MKVVVIGSGGREHALLWKLSRSKRISDLYALPGNGGAARIAHQVTAGSSGVDDLVFAIDSLQPDLVVVGPEQPLADGLADRLISRNIECFGPTAAATRIEASKVFSKELMREHKIPTADFHVFDDFTSAEVFVRGNPSPSGWVVKADGLAAGKGAFVCENDEDTIAQARALLVDRILGNAGQRIVIEEKLFGTEASALFWTDGERAAALPVSRDYKRAEDGDTGPNTGGMGAYCPAGHVSLELLTEVEKIIVQPTLRALRDKGSPYKGLLYVGLMMTDSGPKVIEYNCRFGDPETQVIMPVIDDDIVDVMLDCARGILRPDRLTTTSRRSAVCVVLAAEGYPGSYRKSIELHTVDDSDHAVAFHAGTKIDHGRLISTGGRVLNAVGIGVDIHEAREHAYDLAQQLQVPGLRYREDIAVSILETS